MMIRSKARRAGAVTIHRRLRATGLRVTRRLSAQRVPDPERAPAAPEVAGRREVH